MVIPAGALDDLLAAITGAGYEVLGPTVRGGAIVIGTLTAADQLPRGWGDAQDGGTYRIVERGDGAYFGFAAPAGTWKRHLFPPRTVLWRSRRDGDGVVFEEVEQPVRRRAFLGIRGCDLSAIAVQDRVFVHGRYGDPTYAARRQDLLLVGVDCGDPASTCFCTSMGTGPAAGDGADLVLTELDPANPDRHRFLVRPLSERGSAIADRLRSTAADDTDLEGATAVTHRAADRMHRRMNTDGLPQLLAASPNHPRWDDVAARCLSCGNCTMACPTCFCSNVSDEPDVAAGVDERVREWASCFQLGHSYLHGGSLRVSTKSRYRQWMTHKLSTWWDQFGVSGCVGCGRCIAWCPVGIDITEEVRAIRARPGAVAPMEGG